MEDKRIITEISRSKQLINFFNTPKKEKPIIQEEIEQKEENKIVTLLEFVNGK